MAKCKRKGTVVQKQKENIRRVYIKGWFSFRGTVERCTYAGGTFMSNVRVSNSKMYAYAYSLSCSFFRISNHYFKGVL